MRDAHPTHETDGELCATSLAATTVSLSSEQPRANKCRPGTVASDREIPETNRANAGGGAVTTTRAS